MVDALRCAAVSLDSEGVPDTGDEAFWGWWWWWMLLWGSQSIWALTAL